MKSCIFSREFGWSLIMCQLATCVHLATAVQAYHLHTRPSLLLASKTLNSWMGGHVAYMLALGTNLFSLDMRQ